MNEYNQARPHQGRWCYGKTPMQTFLDTLPIAKEKSIRAGRVTTKDNLLLSDTHHDESAACQIKSILLHLIRDGLLPARQICVGAPYAIQQDDLGRPAVRRAIENGRAVSLDARQESMSFQ